MNKKKVYVFTIVGLGLLNSAFHLHLYFSIPTEIRITEEKGYTILNQELYPITLTIPKNVLTEDAYTSEGQLLEPFTSVFEEGTTMVCLEHVKLSEDSDSELYFSFVFLNKLEKNGSMIIPYWIREDGQQAWSSFVEHDLTVDGESYPNAVYMRRYGPQSEFVLRVSKDVCDLLNGKIELHVMANELFYAKGRVEHEPEIYSEEKIIRILKSYRIAELDIIDCVYVPESERGIIGVVLYKDTYGLEENYEIAFVKEDEEPRILYLSSSNLTDLNDLEYVGNDAVTYMKEVTRGDLKTVWKEKVTLEETEKKGIYFDFVSEIVDETINEPKN